METSPGYRNDEVRKHMKATKPQDQHLAPEQLAGSAAGSSQHIVLPYRDPRMTIFGVSSRDMTYYDGSYHQFSGHRRNAVFTLGIKKDQLDGPIKRVGFMGTDNSQAFQKEVGPSAEHDNGLWDLEFELYVFMLGQTFHTIIGSFYVETVSCTYYWLKNWGTVDFEFDSNSTLILNNWYPPM
jgi:hypothetical protein